MFDRLTVAVDSSPESDRALDLARDIALQSGGTLHLVHVVEHVRRSGRAPGYDIEEADATESLLEKEVGVLKEAGVPHTIKIIRAPVGHTANEILAAAKEESSEAIIMGSRGLSELTAAIIGSTAYKVLHLADRPVIVAR
jgi:nucleotide-binding universal stress UspA family protein